MTLGQINTNCEAVPVWERYLLTIKDAVKYFSLGENTIRDLIKEDNCDFVIYKGKKAFIKRKKFEEYIDNMKYL